LIYGHSVFPIIDKAALGIVGAYGEGRVYEQGKYVGDTKMTQLCIGFQAGGQGCSQIVFLQDKRAFDDCTSGNFEFGANVNAVVITAAASGTAATTGTTGTASGGKKDATATGEFHKRRSPDARPGLPRSTVRQAYWRPNSQRALTP
jgi:lipid-binding SYLF domain-containing protein